MLDKTREAVLTCALRFDGYGWAAQQGASANEALSRCSTNFVETLTPFVEQQENFAAFFALQRWLHKWGGEMLPENARDWLAYWQLFLHLWSVDVPVEFRYEPYYSDWQQISSNASTIANDVRSHVIDTFGGMRPRFVSPWWKLLKKPQLGRYAEHFVKLEFLKSGAEVYATEVDDRGVDLVVRLPSGKFLPVQVKAVRSDQVIYLDKRNFTAAAESLLAVVDFTTLEEPKIYLVPVETWGKPDRIKERFTAWTDKAGVEWWQLPIDRKSLAVLQCDFNFEATLMRLHRQVVS